MIEKRHQHSNPQNKSVYKYRCNSKIATQVIISRENKKYNTKEKAYEKG